MGSYKKLTLTQNCSDGGKAMYCNYCGKVIPDDSNLCAYCGKRVAGVIARERLVRPRQGRKIAGVCAGLAEYYDLDATLIRIVWAVCVICGGVGLLAYIAAWIIIPEEPLMLAAAPPATQDRVANR
jgi:phage shock protein C